MSDMTPRDSSTALGWAQEEEACPPCVRTVILAAVLPRYPTVIFPAPAGSPKTA